MTIRSALEAFAGKHPDHVAHVFCRGKEWANRTYAAFLEDVRKTAEAYGSKFDLKPREENVAQILPNSPEWMDVYLACSGAGVSVVPLDPKLHNDEVHYILKDSGAVVVTTDAAHIPMMQQIAPELPNLRAIVIVDGGAPSYAAIGNIPVYDFAELKKQGCTCGWYDRNVCKEDDVASVIYTSGTTGKPKGAMLTHANFTEDATGVKLAIGLVMLTRVPVRGAYTSMGSKKPNDDIKRNETAAIINRVALPENRVKGTVDFAYDNEDYQFDAEFVSEDEMAHLAFDGEGQHIKDGKLIFKAKSSTATKTGYDPGVMLNGIEADATEYSKIKIRMKYDFFEGQNVDYRSSIYFVTEENPALSEKQSYHFDLLDHSYVDAAPVRMAGNHSQCSTME